MVILNNLVATECCRPFLTKVSEESFWDIKFNKFCKIINSKSWSLWSTQSFSFITVILTFGIIPFDFLLWFGINIFIFYWKLKEEISRQVKCLQNMHKSSPVVYVFLFATVKHLYSMQNKLIRRYINFLSNDITLRLWNKYADCSTVV